MASLPRRKQPQQVRRNLLNAAAEIASEHGLEFVTTAEVAKRAGVTSGGLFHHFPSKKHLIDEMINAFMKSVETCIEDLIKKDPDPRGRFTRAYLVSSYGYDPRSVDNRLLGAIITAMNRDPELAEPWADWMEKQMEKYDQEKDPILASIVRYAADGLWMEIFAASHVDFEKRQAAFQRLMDWTRQL